MSEMQQQLRDSEELELQQLKAERKQQDARIKELERRSALRLSSSSRSNLAASQDGRRHSTPRNPGLLIDTGSQHALSRDLDYQRMKRSKTSAHDRRVSSTLTGMARSNSAMSSKSSPANNPFAGSGLVTLPSVHPASQQVDGSFSLHYWNQDMMHQPANGRLVGQAAGSMGNARSPLDLSSPMEGGSSMDFGMDVGQFLQINGHHDVPTNITSRGYLSPTDAQPQYSPIGDIPSSCGSLTEAATLETPMSRRNSIFDNVSISGPVAMLKLESQSSTQTGPLSHQDSRGFHHAGSHSFSTMPPAGSDEALLGLGASLSYPTALSSSEPTASHLSHMEMGRSDSYGSIDFGDDMQGTQCMERSDSNMSTKSNQSLKRRAKEALNRQCANAMMGPQLKPKPISAKPVGHSGAGAKSKDGKKELPNAKIKYERPKHPKVRCPHCEEYPDGFRGEHELRRHTEAKHRDLVRKWVCQDPHAKGITGGVVAVNPLEKCKACSAGKQYGAYYNAAAHLRRTHFKEKPPRKGHGKNAKSDGVAAEKRGGKAGGDWPPMTELKNWMTEVLMPAGGQADGANDDDDDEDMMTAPMISSGEVPPEMLASMGYDPTEFHGDFQHIGATDLSAYSGPVPPISSASFCNSHVSYTMSTPLLDGHTTTSPVESSTATITQAHVYESAAFEGMGINHMGISSTTDPFEFDMAFTPNMTTTC